MVGMSSSKKDESWSTWGAKFGLTGIAAMSAEGATFPVDITKTRMQLAGEGVAGGQVGFMTAGMGIVRNEGVMGLYKGVSPAIARHIPYTGTRVILYEYLRKEATKDGAKPSFLTRLAMGFTAGGTAQTIAVPMDLIKVRMQADGKNIAAGKLDKPRYTGLIHALKTIHGEEGLAGLWKGAVPAVQRAALVNLGELATYDTAKQFWLGTGYVGDNVYCHVLSAVCSGFFASLASTPADVVKTRLMNESGVYKGSIDCFVKTAQSEGIRGLYKGFLPGWARLGPWQLVFWVTFEQLRVVAGFDSF
jgi:solute carrier family 25 uncoupling protein 27